MVIYKGEPIVSGQETKEINREEAYTLVLKELSELTGEILTTEGVNDTTMQTIKNSVPWVAGWLKILQEPKSENQVQQLLYAVKASTEEAILYPEYPYKDPTESYYTTPSPPTPTSITENTAPSVDLPPTAPQFAAS